VCARAGMNETSPGRNRPSALPSWVTASRASPEPCSHPDTVTRMSPPGGVCSIHAAGTVRTAHVAMIRSYGAGAGYPCNPSPITSSG